jgi:hypothetical protein
MLAIEAVAAVLFVASSGLLFNERFRRNRYLVVAAAVIALASTYFLTEQLIDRALSRRLDRTASESTVSEPEVATASPNSDSGSPPEPVAPVPSDTTETLQPPDPNRIVLDFGSLRTNYPPDFIVAAAPFLHAAPIPIDVVDVTPDESRVVFKNNLGLYGGRAVQPTVSQNFLTQVNIGPGPSSFTLRFAEPVTSVTFLIPAIFPATESGVTFPAWRATAYSRSGRVLSTTSEVLARRLANAPSQTYTLRAPDFEGIVEVEFASDWRLDGRPFAGFESLLIEQVVIQR